MDAALDDIFKRISNGKSLLDASDEIFGKSDSGGFNTYPMGKPGRLWPELFAVCEDPMKISSAFDYICWWCHETDGMFPKRRVVLLTDDWTTKAYKSFEDLFRRFANQHGVKFEFYLYMLGSRPAKINLPF